MTLKWNAKDNCYMVVTTDADKAERAGLTHSTKLKGPRGEPVYFTGDYKGRPVDNPYAVLCFYDEAEPSAKARLDHMKADFEMSWKTQGDKIFKAKGDKSYLPYQNAGIAYGVEKGNVLIGDEPGLGKTVQAIGIANEIQADKVLIVVPASIRLNWQRELNNWSLNPDMNIQVFKNSKGGFRPGVNTGIFSYELAKHPGLHAAIMAEKWDLLVIDEAHYAKTEDASRTRALFGGGNGPFRDKFIADRVENIVALTGTPLPNRPRECYTIAKALCPEAFDWMSFDDFQYRFNPFATTQTPTGEIISIEKKGRLSELQARLRSNFMIRRLKKDVLTDLPDKRYEFTYIEPDGRIQEVLQRESLLDFEVEDLKNPFAEIWGMISTIRREMGEAKVPRVVEHMKFLLDIMELPKVVLFAHHRTVLDRLEFELEKYGVVSVRGGMSMFAKDKSVQGFQRDPQKRIFLGQMDSAGFGIDGLQNVCSHVVFAEPAWTPGTNEQAVDRCHRIGQHDNVLAQFLVVEGSLDERVLAKMLGKYDTIYNSLDRAH